MTYAQIVALVDIAIDTDAEDSPRWDGRTLAALVERRELVQLPHIRDTKKETRSGRLKRFKRARLTKKGEAYLNMAQYEYKTCEDFLKAAAA